MTKIDIKEALLKQCGLWANDKYERLQKVQLDIKESLLSETKSSSGDKHETGRARLQIERENIGKQLHEAQKLQELLHRIDVKTTSGLVHLGSLVSTHQANYFMSVSIGALSLDNEVFLAVSPQSPIGNVLLGKKVGDAFSFNNEMHEIISVD